MFKIAVHRDPGKSIDLMNRKLHVKCKKANVVGDKGKQNQVRHRIGAICKKQNQNDSTNKCTPNQTHSKFL